MNDLQIETFLEVVRHNNFSKAAQELMIPQPTLTHRLKQLEEELDEMLFYRSPKGVSLTLAGKRFLPYARQIYDAMSRGKKEILAVSKGNSGLLSFGASNALSQYVLPSLLEQFLHSHPHLQINIIANPSDIVIEKLLERKYTFGLTRHFKTDPDLKFELLHEDQIHLAASPHHHFSKLDKIDLEEACKEPLFIYPEGTFFHSVIEKTLLSLHIRIQNPIEINHAELIKSLVKSGFGISLLPGLYIKKELESGELISLPLSHNPFLPRGTYIAYNKDYTDGSFQIFLEFCRSFFQKL